MKDTYFKVLLVIKIHLEIVSHCKMLLKLSVIHDTILSVALMAGLWTKPCVSFLKCLLHSKLKGLYGFLTAGNTVSAVCS